jgi:hypothetical protein
VDPLLALGGEPEVLDRVGDVGPSRVNPRLLKSADEEPTGRPDKGLA